MATNEEDSAVVNTPFLHPPTFWQSFTAENVEAYHALEKASADSDKVIPEDLQNLRPPAPPANGEYTVFGEKRSLDAPLVDLPEETPALQSGIGKSTSPQHLLNLTRSLMLSYLEMLHVMAINPAPPIYGVKWEDLRDLFRNVHHGVNSYRPWQARNALIKLLENTRNGARAEIAEVQALQTKVDDALQSIMHNCEEVTLGIEDKPEHDTEMTNGIEQNHDPNGATITNGLDHNDTAHQRSRIMWDLVNGEHED